ncbi:MAG: formyl transferase [Chitinophagales bacterium]|nr:formyl transferase [Chitinophagales bacterium]MDW8417952.1 formyl transferase [Chitinophagales bacterium]
MSNSKVVLLAGKGMSTHIVYHALAARFDVAAVILEEKESAWKFIRRRASKLGWFTAISQVLFQVIIARILATTSAGRRKEILQQYQLNTDEIPGSLIRHVTSVNTPACIDLLRELSPAVVVVNGTRIISGKVLRAVPVPFINMHAGITPRYRGVHGGYWALVNRDPERCGVTVHLVDTGVDTGNILYQELIRITDKDNFTTYPLLQLAAGLPRLCDAVRDALQQRLQPITSAETESKQWYHPTLCEYLRHRLISGVK